MSFVRRARAGAPPLLLAALLAAGAAACGSSRGAGRSAAATGRPASSALREPASRSGARAASSGADPAGTGTTHEVADPTEAQSYPAPAGVHHSAAAAPATAGASIVAAGAMSNAEVSRDLAETEAAQKAAAREQHAHLLTAVPGGESIGGDGRIPIPLNVPEAVQKVIAGANEIADFPYVFGGGHASFIDDAYDCSGSVSYALAAGGLLSRPEVSGELEHWGAPGRGRYITVYASAGHAYMYVDGILFDTAGRSGVYASRWLVGSTDNAGYVARHWPGY